jgi:type IV pilus assembly protein PilE
MKIKIKKLKAFTLQDLLIALAIMGILVLVAVPNLLPLISRAKSSEAQLQLEHINTLEKGYFYRYSKYSTDLKEIDFEPAKLVSEGGEANYKIEIVEATSNTFKATATAITDFDGDGVFNVWEVDQDKRIKEVVQD